MRHRSHRPLRIASLAALVLFAGTACIPARVGARCATTEWGQNSTHVLRCVNGRWRIAMTRQQAIDLWVAVVKASLPEVGAFVSPATLGSPGLPNTADPSVFVEGGTTYVFATSTYQRVPVYATTNIDAPAPTFATTDSMPQKPAWASSTEIWAPTVNKVGGRYVMFFAAHRSGAPDPLADQCVGKATAASPAGPYSPDPSPLTCGNDGIHGALDPSLFVDPRSGAPTLLVAMGGSNRNLWAIPLDGNANRAGADVLLLSRVQPWQDWFLENPAMWWDGRHYLLAYSAGRWDSPSYMTGIARCASPTGPCTDQPNGPWIASAGDRVGPGGLEFFTGSDGARGWRSTPTGPATSAPSASGRPTSAACSPIPGRGSTDQAGGVVAERALTVSRTTIFCQMVPDKRPVSSCTSRTAPSVTGSCVPTA